MCSSDPDTGIHVTQTRTLALVKTISTLTAAAEVVIVRRNKLCMDEWVLVLSVGISRPSVASGPFSRRLSRPEAIHCYCTKIEGSHELTCVKVTEPNVCRILSVVGIEICKYGQEIGYDATASVIDSQAGFTKTELLKSI